MSLHLEFNPHSWYMGFAIKQNTKPDKDVPDIADEESPWEAYTDDGNTYRIVDFEAKILKRLKQKIRSYHLRKHNGYGERIAAKRLNQIREEIQAERAS